MSTKGRLSQADDRLAASVLKERRPTARRRYRCDGCGLQYPADELNPVFNEDERRVGWACDSCY